jgi:ubiquinone/menaquinone biosynthesis C-methylase UbiE
MTHYVIRGGAEGKKRLEVLARVLGPTTARLWERAGLRRGMTVLDLGCGGGDVALELARRVGPDGHVVGVDMDPAKLELARQAAVQQGLGHIEFRQLDAGRWDEGERYDFVYCRFLLTHLSDPVDVVRRMRRAVRPGGVAAVEDIDFTGHFCHPRCPAFERYVSLYRAVVARRGGDADIGPKLYGMLTEAGWHGVNLEVVQPVFVAGEGKRLALLTLVNIAEAVVAEGLATEQDVRATADELAAFTDDPRTIISLPRIVQVWGRRD